MKPIIPLLIFIIMVNISSVLGIDSYVYNCSDLQNMKNNGSALITYKLMNNIDCMNTTSWNGGYGFQGMGGQNGEVATFWESTFEGNGYTISNLYSRNDSGYAYMGIFADTGTSSIIRNVGIINATIIGEGTGYSGILGGSIRGKVDNVFVRDSKVVSQGSNVGGFAGLQVNNQIKNCYSERNNISAVGQLNLGGIAGNQNYGINACWSNTTQNGIAVGGISGQLYSSQGIWNTISLGQSYGSQAGVYLGYQNGYPVGNNAWLNTTGINGVGNCDYGGVCPTNDTNFSDASIYYNTRTRFPLNYWDFESIWREVPNSMPRLYFEIPQINITTQNNTFFNSNTVSINYSVISTAYSLVNCSYNVDGGAFTNSSCNNLTLTLGNGRHEIIISAINNQNYIYNKSITINRDNRTILLSYIGNNNFSTPQALFNLTFNVTCLNDECGKINLTMFEKSFARILNQSSFESANDATEGYTDASNAYSYTSTGSRTGTYSVFTDGSRTNVLFNLNQGIDVSKYSRCNLSVWFKGTSQLDTGDGICFDYSMNNGVTWNTATTYSASYCVTPTQDNNAYWSKSYAFTPTATTVFKWRIRARTGDSTEDVWADDLNFTCYYDGGILPNSKFQLTTTNPFELDLSAGESQTVNISINPLSFGNFTLFSNTTLMNNTLVYNLSQEVNFEVDSCLYKGYGNWDIRNKTCSIYGNKNILGNITVIGGTLNMFGNLSMPKPYEIFIARYSELFLGTGEEIR